MTPPDLKEAAIKLYGHRHWHVRLSADLGVDRTTLWRWANGHTPIPGPVKAAVTCWLAQGQPVSTKRT